MSAPDALAGNTPLSTGPALAALATALAAVVAAEAEITAVGTRAAGFLADAGKRKAELEALNAAAADREAEALVAALSIPEVPVAEKRQGDKLERAIRANHAAAEKTANEAKPLAEKKRAADAAAVDATLGASRAVRNAGQQAFSAALEGAIGHLADMVASQRLRDHYAGTTFDFDGRRNPPAELWDGEITVGKFLAALPARLSPENYRKRVEAAAVERLAALLAAVENGS